ncbi:hypothetical protein [Amycolatopsis viridis]|uniref:Secreted protein n=1 Tax=Amycolatopsis viridis TaxID=185678 RepID=A0ABX0SNM5_9PSEU|nr:hypothetical protein [Amycolatopsis viridis]NIH78572.1 hypothetical protein [Amycolatopsis viridis]
MKLRKTMLTAATLAVTAASALTITGTATATTDPPGGSYDHVYTAEDHAAQIYVQERNDVIKLCDIRANGKPAHMDVFVEGSSRNPVYTVDVKGGLGSCVTHSASQGKPYILPKGRRVYLHFWGTAPDGTSVSFTSR